MLQRKTFPKIAYQEHPDATGEHIARSLQCPDQKPTKTDLAIATEVLRIHEVLRKQSEATGEWKWINDNRRSEYMSILESGDVARLADCLANMFRRDAAYGIITGDYAGIHDPKQQYDLENQILLNLDALTEFSEKGWPKKWLTSPEKCGNAFGYLTDRGDLITADAPRHVYFAEKILGLLSSSRAQYIVEIGGGYGGLCFEVMRQIKDRQVKYIDCDLPETLYMAYFFLRKALPSSVTIAFAIDKIPEADVVLVPAQLKHLIRKANLVFNANSLSEMGKKTVREYFDLIHEVKPEFFLHQNSNFVLFPDSERHIEVIASEFPIDRSKYHLRYQSVAPLKALSEIDRVVKDGGYLIIGDFDPDFPTRTVYHHAEEEGVFTYKLDYAEIFRKTGLYQVVARTTFLHGKNIYDATVPAERRGVVTLLRKSWEGHFAE